MVERITGGCALRKPASWQKLSTAMADAKVLHLPDIGIYGNTHFLFEDKNNEEIADLMDRWIVKKGLGE